MNKKFFLFFVGLLAVFSSAYAKKKVDEKVLGPENSWQEEFNINEKKPGKYNIMVEARDKAGNESVAGPFNIYIDKESDLPVTGITNPIEQMRVPGNLNIVGTCIDDDTVTAVYLILDGDEEHPVKAEGTEFWSYFLSTNDLKEGPHTIEAYGVDDGNPRAYKNEEGVVDTEKVVPKTGNRVKVTWQLDRRAPVTEITNHDMGSLVSGKMNLEGRVTDGNGIMRLEYSLDGGQFYKEVKLKEVKYKEPTEEGLVSEFRFTVPVDTTKFKDGAATCWFKATDNAGSIGRFAFLYFIDNTKPDVKIITPIENEVKNGIFTVAGYAKDIIGIEKLSWTWGDESGDFDLTPGNPYWVKEVNSIGKSKSELFTVTATDTMGNTVVVKRNILLDQEADKPIVQIMYPSSGVDVEGEDGTLFLRGIAYDDDGVVSVSYKLDGGEEKTLDCTGIFYASIEGSLSAGNHTISVYAKDKYGVKGNTVSSTFVSKGVAPEFEKAVYKDSSKTVDYTDGITVNPEADGSYEVKVSSSSGLAAIDYEVLWGTKGRWTGSTDVSNGDKSARVSVPLNKEEIAWGLVRIEIKAKDIYDRVSTNSAFINLRDLTKPYADVPEVVFDDSVVEEDGTVVYNETKPLTGFFAAGKISSVALVPSVKGVSVSSENSVITVTGSGTSSEFAVQVVTDSGAAFTSRTMKFVSPKTQVALTVDSSKDYDTSKLTPFRVESAESKLKISGNAKGDDVKVYYRLLGVNAVLENGVLTSSSKLNNSEVIPVELTRRGNWTINLDVIDSDDNAIKGFEGFKNGIAVVEIVAETSDGQKASEAVFIKKIPFAPTETVMGANGKPLVKAVPKVYWLTGEDYYGVCVYQGDVTEDFKYIRRKNCRSDSPSVTFKVSPTDLPADTKKVPEYSSDSLNVAQGGTVKAEIVKIDGKDYKSGMQLKMDRNAPKDAGRTAVIHVVANGSISAVEYKITGTETAGGQSNQSGNAVLNQTVKDEENGIFEYDAEIPLGNLPARVTKIEATAKDTKGTSATVKGSFIVLREKALTESSRSIYWTESHGTVYDDKLGGYVLSNGGELYGYANIMNPSSASVRGGVEGLTATVEGNVVKFGATKDGVYRGVGIRVKDENGGSYTSPEVTLIVDTSAPVITLDTLKTLSFVKNKFNLGGTVTDGNGVASLEYSIQDKRKIIRDETGAITDDGNPEWKSIAIAKGGAFWTTVDITDQPDGYIPVSLRAKDTTGKISVINTVVHKDVTPPEVKVILPDAESVINGENTILFEVKDAGLMNQISYVSAGGKRNNFEYFTSPSLVPPLTEKILKKNSEGVDEEIEVPVKDSRNPIKTLNSSMPWTRVGIDGMPVDNKMQFVFTDANGNKTEIKEWAFKVDEESDKPRTEIHLPEEKQVITTDFVISGVIYDDDGACQLYYKVDDGKYNLLSETYASSYKIHVPISAMTDNEHTITAYSVDVNGVKGEETKRTFRISLAEPEGGVTTPEIDKTVKETVTIKGWAKDKNGISKVQVSIDNGATFNDAVGTTEWSYTFDTRVVQDGTHVVFIRIYDGYEITGLYSSLINIDNTPPNLNLELPLDDSKTSKNIFFSGQTTDNIGLTNLYITIRSLENKPISPRLAKRELVPEEIITQILDISQLDNGFYNIELTGTDAAGNITRVSRNIELDKTKPLTKISQLYPLNGEHVQGEFNIYGTAYAEKEDPLEYVELYVDFRKMIELGQVPVSETGYYNFRLKGKYDGTEIKSVDENGNEVVTIEGGFVLTEGNHTYNTIGVTKSGKRITSNTQNFIYSPYGPWVTLDNFSYGDFAVDRPLIKGKAGYILTDEEKAALKNKNTPTEYKVLLENKKVRRIYLSFDNGKTYQPVSKKEKGNWEYRIENLDIPAGIHFMLVKAEMASGENAITRTIVQIDRTAPVIKLINPGEGGHYNQLLGFNGLTSDDVDLKDVKLSLRSGDKASYEVPGFIQGLYLDGNFWGSSLYQVGIGLTAFDGAVKVQMNFGQFTRSQREFVNEFLGLEDTMYRFGGNVIGGKIIAQLAYIPFRYFFGRDWDWLSATVAVGANFSYFTDSGPSVTTGKEEPQMLSALIGQIEFPRVTFANWKCFKTWATYWEPQIWFIPSDVAGDSAQKYVFTWSVGMRTSVF